MPHFLSWQIAFVLGMLPQWVGSQEVLVGSAGNFSRLIKQHDKLLVEFYAPWCGHCRALAPEYDRAAFQLNKQGLKSKLMKVDATEETSLASAHRVSSYPTLKYFRSGQSQEYRGGMTADTIVQWLRRREVDPFERIEEGAVQEFLGKARAGEFAVVARVKKGSVRDKAFKAALSGPLLADYDASPLHFAVVDLSKGADPKGDSSLAMRRPGFRELGETLDVIMPGAWSEKSVSKWILQQTFPTVGTEFKVAKYSADLLEKAGWEGVAVAVLNEGAGPQKSMQEVLRRAAAKYPAWRFVATLRSGLGQSEERLLAAGGGSVLTALRGAKKYQLKSPEGEMAGEAKVLDFLQQVQAGKARPHYKSEDPPSEPRGQDNVVTVTGRTFEDVVLDSSKDVFVEFYAPWCGHCKKLAPEWSKLGRRVASDGLDRKGVVIAKMDATANECDEEVIGYPKLVLFPAVPRQRKMRAKIQYSGERELDPMLDFLMENARGLDGIELRTGKGGSDMAKRDFGRKRSSKMTEL